MNCVKEIKQPSHNVGDTFFSFFLSLKPKMRDMEKEWNNYLSFCDHSFHIHVQLSTTWMCILCELIRESIQWSI